MNGNLDRSYPLEAGELFLVTTRGPKYEVKQRPLDIAALATDATGIQAGKARLLMLADDDPHVSAFVGKPSQEK